LEEIEILLKPAILPDVSVSATTEIPELETQTLESQADTTTHLNILSNLDVKGFDHDDSESSTIYENINEVITTSSQTLNSELIKLDSQNSIEESKLTESEETTTELNTVKSGLLESEIDEVTFGYLISEESTTSSKILESEMEISNIGLVKSVEQTTLSGFLETVEDDFTTLLFKNVNAEDESTTLHLKNVDEETTTVPLLQSPDFYVSKITVDTFDVDGQVELKKVSNKNIFEELKNTIASVVPRQPEVYNIVNDEPTTVDSNGDETTANVNLYHVVFDETTIAFPDGDKIALEVVAEKDDLNVPEVQNPEFDETTIAFPIEPVSLDPQIPLKDEQGLLIDTTTGYSIYLNKVSAVEEAVRKSGRHPVKQTPLDSLQNGLQTSEDEKEDHKEFETTTFVEEDQTTTLAPEINNNVLLDSVRYLEFIFIFSDQGCL